MATEIAIIAVASDSEFEQLPIACIYLIAVPLVVETGLVFTASHFRSADKYILISFVAGVSICIMTPLSLVTGPRLGSVLILGPSITSFILLTLVLTFHRNKRRYQTCSAFFCLAIGLPLGFVYALFYDEDNGALILAVIVVVAFISVAIVCFFELADYIRKIKAYIFLMFKREGNLPWHDIIYFIITAGCNLSVAALLYFCLEAAGGA